MESKVVAEYYMTGQYTDANALVEELLQLDRKDVCDIVVNLEQKVITTASIPQYSSFDDGTTNLIQFLRMAGNFGPSFVEVGKHYLETGHQERAYLNDLGIAIEHRSVEEQHECFIKLSARVPIVQYALKNNIESDKELENVLGDYLARSTALRRRRNTWYLVSAIRGEEL